MAITPVYASILTLMYLVLSLRVIRRRRAAKVALGDGGDEMLRRRQRAHGNFAEYVPLALLLMAMAELQGLPGWKLHAIGLMLLGGRALHAYGVSQDPEPLRLRVFGMILTFAVLFAGAVGNLVMAVVNQLSNQV